MTNTSEEFSNRSTPDVLHLWSENRAWSKQLRLSSKGLVTSRLAHQMDAAEYATARQLSNLKVAECKRLESVLMHEIRLREAEGYDARRLQNTL